MKTFKVVLATLALSLALIISGCNGTPLSVVETFPANGATNLPLNTAISIQFNQEIDTNVANAATFTVSDEAHNNIAGTVMIGGATAVFTPTTTLTNSTTYTATVTGGETPYSWSFTTGKGADHKAPTVVASFPVNGATDFATTGALTVTFSEALNASTVNDTSIQLLDLNAGSIAIATNITIAANTVTITPQAELKLGGRYTLSVGTTIADMAGNTLANAYAATFTTHERAWGAPPVALQTGTDTTKFASLSQLLTAKNGNATFIWTAARFFSNTNTYRTDLLARHYDAATGTWSSTVDVLAQDIYFISDMTAAIDDAGVVSLAYEQTFTGPTRYELRVRRYTPGTGWSAPTILSTDTDFIYLHNKLATDSAGNVLLVYQRSNTVGGLGTHTFYSKYTPTTASWSAPVQFDNFPGASNPVSLSMEPGGKAVLTWAQFLTNTSTQISISRYSPDTGWTSPFTPQGIASSGFFQSGISLISRNGDIMAAISNYTASTNSTTLREYYYIAAENNWVTRNSIPIDPNNKTIELIDGATDYNGNFTFLWNQANAFDGSQSAFGIRRLSATEGNGEQITMLGYNSSSLQSGAFPPPQGSVSMNASGDALVAVPVYIFQGTTRSIWTFRFDANTAKWDPATRIDGDFVSDEFPLVSLAQSGNALCTWMQQGQGATFWATSYR